MAEEKKSGSRARREPWQPAALVAGVLCVCLVGFLDATRAREYTPVVPEWSARPVHEGGHASPARRYDELAVRPWGAGETPSGLGARAPALAGATALVSATPVPDARRSSGPRTREALADRAELRAYDGAPPTVPHPVRQRSAGECLACHGPGLALGAAVARPLPHPEYASCTQCHVVSGSPVPPAEPSPAATARNRFRGLASPERGARAWFGAPPVIPHATWMREQCIACHGTAARSGLHSSHPERQSCTQCHAPSAALNQRASAEPRSGR